MDFKYILGFRIEPKIYHYIDLPFFSIEENEDLIKKALDYVRVQYLLPPEKCYLVIGSRIDATELIIDQTLKIRKVTYSTVQCRIAFDLIWSNEEIIDTFKDITS